MISFYQRMDTCWNSTPASASRMALSKHSLMDNMSTTSSSVECTLTGLPQELLSLLFGAAGVQEVLPSLPKNSKLHGAWQAAVAAVRVNPSTLTDADITSLKKLVNLRKIGFCGGPPTEVPLWRVLALVTPALARLNTITFTGSGLGAYSALTAIAHLNDISARLKELRITDRPHDLSSDDLWVLASLKAVTKLALVSVNLTSEQGRLRGPCSKLGHLRVLELKVTRDASPEQLAVFPGSLTALTALDLSREGFDQDMAPQQLASAVSKLSNLQSLSTSLAPPQSEAGQQQALGHLQQLTSLRLAFEPADGQLCAPLYVQAQLPDLVELAAFGFAVHDPFDHPSLKTVSAARIVAAEKWRGKAAEQSLIEEISTWGTYSKEVADADYRNMPLLPALHIFECCRVKPSNGRYLHLAALLRRQAHRLQHVSLDTLEPLEDMLPRELPVCKELQVHSKRVSLATLQLLGMCSMPALEKLRLGVLRGAEELAGLDVEADLGWLRSLPALRTLWLGRLSELGYLGNLRVRDITTEQRSKGVLLRSAVEAMMQGTGVVVPHY